ncbi:MAG: CoA-binding protein [Phycisphaerae bacterium]|nr:CoA-binding protein [Phycisphaerae bacterium]
MSKRKYIAIIGASLNRRKFGNKAVRAYAKSGWRVYPVHPTEEEIEGFEAFPSILHLPGPVDRVSIYLPPQEGLRILEDIRRVQPAEVWVNPGAESEELLAKAKSLGLNVIQACSILEVGVSPAELVEE